MEENKMRIPEGWGKIELGKISTFTTGRKDVNEGNDEGIYPFYTCSKNISHSDSYSFNKEALLIAGNGDVGTVHYCNGKFEAYQRTYVLSDFSIDVKYLYHYLKSNLVSYLLQEQSGTTIQFIKIGQLTGFDILLPKSLTEQKKIAEILSTVDKAIEQTEQLIAKYQRIKTGLMQDLLTKGIDENGNIRSEETHEFKDSLLGRIPVEWEVEDLNYFKEFITSGSRGWAKYYSIDGHNFIRITNLKRKQIKIDTENMQYVNLPKGIEGMRSKLIEGDLLVSITADLGIIGIYSDDIGESYINQHIALVRLNLNKIDARFIGYFLSSEKAQLRINFLNDGGAKAGLNLKTVLSFPVIKVSKTEQALIVKKIESTEKYIDSLKIEMNKYVKIKTALMQDLLSGQKRVTNLLKEEAL